MDLCKRQIAKNIIIPLQAYYFKQTMYSYYFWEKLCTKREIYGIIIPLQAYIIVTHNVIILLQGVCIMREVYGIITSRLL